MYLNNSLKHKLYLSIKQLKRRFSWHKGVKAFKQYTASMISIERIIADRLDKNHVKATYVFFSSLDSFRRSNGMKFVAQYLKGCSIYTMQYLAFNKRQKFINSTIYDVHIALTHSGIPRIFPVYWRQGLRDRNPVSIRIVLTVLNLYRVIPFLGKAKLSTITDPFIGTVPESMIRFIPIFWLLINPVKLSFIWYPNLLASSGAIVSGSGRNSSSGFLLSLLSLYRDKSLWESVSWFFKDCPQRRGWKARNERSFIAMTELGQKLETSNIPTLPLGRLAFKDEPGKVRVFAMVDCLTQWVLRPLHDWIFKILREIPTDATFDQEGGVERIRQKILEAKGQIWCYSLDLSAATDRLPLCIQIPLLDSVFPNLGKHWSNILVNREYEVSTSDISKYCLPFTLKERGLRYGTGQPMGAHSSWGMLALTHHFIVQYCAFSVLDIETWFLEYMILGDDIIILNKKVALKYLQVMKTLNVGINLSKSLVSNNGHCEFAKKFISPLGRLEGTSLKEFSSLGNAFSNVLNVSRKFRVRPVNILRLLGFGSFSAGHSVSNFYRMSLNSTIKHILISPIINSEVSWIWWLSYLRPSKYDISDRCGGYIMYLLWDLEFLKYKYVLKIADRFRNPNPAKMENTIDILTKFWFPKKWDWSTLFLDPWSDQRHVFLPSPSVPELKVWLHSYVDHIFANSPLLSLIINGGSADLSSKTMNWELSFEEGGFMRFMDITNDNLGSILSRHPKSWIDSRSEVPVFTDADPFMMQETKDDFMRPCRLRDISAFLDIKNYVISKLYRGTSFIFDVPTIRYSQVFNTKKVR